MIVGLCSTFREGRLAAAAITSLLAACDFVLAYEGPIGGNPAVGDETNWKRLTQTGRVTLKRGTWTTDAAKRTAMLRHAKGRGATWGVVLDGDEWLAYGDALPLWIDAAGDDAVGIPLRLTELDGSVAKVGNRVLRLAHIDSYVLSSYLFRLTNGMEVAVGNEPLLRSGDPDQAWEEGLYQRRKPIAGEPHIVHRSALRKRDRAEQVERQHEAEGKGFERMAAGDGLGFDVGDRAEEGVRLWLPTR